MTPPKLFGPWDPVFLASMFDLTPAEARVASSLAQGLASPRLRTTFDISPETVESHLERIFDKTGTHRQSELLQYLALAAGA